MSRCVTLTAFVVLVAALGVSGAWLWTRPGFDSVITCLTLLSAVIGLFIERFVGERDRRRQFLRALVHEVYMNLNALRQAQNVVLETPSSPKVMPRLYNSTAAVIAASGAFATKRDEALWTRLHAWLQRSTDANARFALTEAITFEHPATATAIHQALPSGAVMQATREALEHLANVLMDGYKKESGIDRNTVLFPNPDDEVVA